MTNDGLGKLLAHADAVAGSAPAPAGDLARDVRAAARRRRTGTRAAAGTLSAVAAILMIALALPQNRPARTSVVTNIPGRHDDVTLARTRSAKDLAAELAAIQSQAAGSEACVTAMLRTEGRVRNTPPAGRLPDPLDRIRAEQDRGAMALVRQADRQYHELDRKESAATGYGRVVELFPKTHWAAVARQRLADIGG